MVKLALAALHLNFVYKCEILYITLDTLDYIININVWTLCKDKW